MIPFFLVEICRWRDVKHSAFEDADHRTYVDLKVCHFVLIRKNTKHSALLDPLRPNMIGFYWSRTSGKRWFIQLRYRHSRGEESQCRRNF